VDALVQDFRYALRLLGKSPAFTAVAVLALALGIGANSVMFSVVNSVLLRPLPFHDAGALLLAQTVQAKTHEQWATSPPDFYAAREQNRTFEELAAFYQGSVNLTGAGEAERVPRMLVSPEFFKVFRVRPALGRDFLRQDEQWGSHRVAILSDGLWRRRYGADAAMAGKTISLNGVAYVVVGVLPPGFSFLGTSAQLFTPVSFEPGDNMNTHNNYFMTMVGRLKPGVTRAQAAADLEGIMQNIIRQYPENRGLAFDVTPLQESFVGGVRRAILVLMGAVGFVLLIACANLANLLLARAAGRSREIAVRAALGASRLRLMRQFLAESLLLALFGGGVGLLLAYWSTDALHAVSPEVLPRVGEIAVDPRVLGFTALVSVATGVLFGLAPAVHGLRVNLNDALKEGTRSAGESGGRQLRSALVIAEVALSLVLLIGAGLMFKSMHRLLRVDTGFDPRNVVTASVNLPGQKYFDLRPESQFRVDAGVKATQYYTEALTAIRSIPGVDSVGAIYGIPLAGEIWGKTATLYDRPLPASARDLPPIQFRPVAGDYFRALRIRVAEGRALDDRDTLRSQFVVVVNREFVRRYMNGRDAIGTILSTNPPASLAPPGTLPPGYSGPEKYTIVGVVDDVHYGTLDSAPLPLVYAPFAQQSEAISMSFVVRATGDPLALLDAMKERLAQIDRDVPLANVASMESLVADSIATPKLEAALLGTFAGLAMLLAAIGIYGVMSYNVTQRTREIGIRMALGAAPGDVLRMVLANGIRLAVVGLGIGLGAALGFTRVMRSLLFGVSTTDPVVFAIIAIALGLMAVLASWLPARRATKVDPMLALRDA
jgi:putative ABC transport system permease protein